MLSTRIDKILKDAEKEIEKQFTPLEKEALREAIGRQLVIVSNDANVSKEDCEDLEGSRELGKIKALNGIGKAILDSGLYKAKRARALSSNYVSVRTEVVLLRLED